MKGFWRFLLQKNLTREWLKGVHYAVFGLGDSSYQKYNFVAKKLDKRLSDLGATAIIERGLGMISTLQELKYLEMQLERARSMTPGKFSGNDRPDCFLRMTKSHLLSRPDSGKDVSHFEFDAVSSSIDYEVGDVLEVLPGQSPAAVDAFIRRCGLNPESYITVVVQPRDAENHHFLNPPLSPVKLKSFIELTMDVASASLGAISLSYCTVEQIYLLQEKKGKDYILIIGWLNSYICSAGFEKSVISQVMSFFATAEHEKERLQYFASPEGRDDLYQYNQKERRTVLEVLEDFPSVQMPFEWLVQLVPPLKTRAYSISSSHSAHPNQVHLTVSVVSWTTPYKRKRTGLCSAWLASLDPEQRVFIPAWFRKGSLPPPPPSLPLILIGPGTGCAPFHGFVEERALQSKTVSTAPIIFFFGCRSDKDDFLYRDFWLSHSQKNGVLSEDKGGGFYVAFSRDQPQKVYVQHKMREQSMKIWSLLTQGAAVYVAGSANKMPSDVFSVFEEIVSTESGVSREAALRWIRTLEKAGKYHVEAWS
ncbi:UNVERIFIED_CONTAM: NADPH-dependent diflavin oxidoreductase 1 [Sesamum latifolium]|uniref:NADPH-dependent diflavin oxidoreductase 1 n=1 Tax=Sesamum latifolium TaxID=2727402 RepID=A0AAW2VY32_9LAMI